MNRLMKATFLSSVFALASLVTPFAYSEETSLTTAADHDRVANRYESEATELKSKISEHRGMSAMYSGMGKSSSGFTSHCDRLIQAYEAAAGESSALADLHHKMAAKLKN
ncbi:MAG: hypothetical protein HYX63_05900 [Gammaproteobacteria bacterium]|nr:hypothetical protein [Gammaproteobacteria bacterium]